MPLRSAACGKLLRALLFTWHPGFSLSRQILMGRLGGVELVCEKVFYLPTSKPNNLPTYNIVGLLHLEFSSIFIIELGGQRYEEDA